MNIIISKIGHIDKLTGLLSRLVYDRPNFDFIVELSDGTPLQRKYGEWDLEMKQHFIKSCFNENTDIGKFIFHRPYDSTNSVKVIDGQHRIKALHEFMDNNFPITDLDGNEIYWIKIPIEIQNSFLKKPITILEYYDTILDDYSLLLIFLSANDTGKRIDEELLQAHKLKLAQLRKLM